jgi:hypothetical protein
MAEGVKHAGYENLGWLFGLRPQKQGPPLLVIAARYYFRREVETDRQLFQGLTYVQIEGLGKAQADGFAALETILTQHAQRFEELLGEVARVVVETGERVKDIQAVQQQQLQQSRQVQSAVHGMQVEQQRQGQQAGQIHDAVLNIQDEQQRQNQQVQGLYQAVQELLKKHELMKRELRPSDSLSIRDGAERQLVKAVVARFRSLPESERRELPALQNALGKLQVVAGEFDGARRDFQEVAAVVGDPGARASAHANAYRAALEQRDWTTALQELVRAATLHPQRFAPFPMDKYQPQRILGAGGFGVAFLCHHSRMKDRLVVKTLLSDGLDRDVGQVFTEAQLLRQLDHPAIIRIQDCDYADEAGKARPYLVMDYFDGVTLEEHIQRNGPLSQADFLAVARPIAEALAAAHAKGILHRDVKPANVLVRKEPAGERGNSASRWQVKLIDFGLALRSGALQQTLSNARGNTIAGSSIAGTLDYAAPEQLGRTRVSVGPYSDVFGFARTCCFALFRTTQPLLSHWNSISKVLAKLLENCLHDDVNQRLSSIQLVLERLDVLSPLQPVVLPAEEEPSSIQEVLPVVQRAVHAVAQEVVPSVLPVVQAVKPSRPAFRPRVLENDAANGRLLTNLAPERVFSLLCRAFMEFGVTNLTTDRDNLTVDGKTGMDLWSFGQKVHGEVRPCSEGSQVIVTSRPTGIILSDWGRGKAEAQKILLRLIDKIREG